MGQGQRKLFAKKEIIAAVWLVYRIILCDIMFT
jgi:hypothetical protein